jgi:site-specific DNA-cytosine methylase
VVLRVRDSALQGNSLNFDDPRSKLFFEFVRLKEELNPKYFLLENVKMKKESQDVISEYLGVEPVEINSALVSAQNRKRLYWTNIPFDMPEDKGIKLLKDVIINDGTPIGCRQG